MTDTPPELPPLPEPTEAGTKYDETLRIAYTGTVHYTADAMRAYATEAVRCALAARPAAVAVEPPKPLPDPENEANRTMLERAWDGFQNRNCGKRQWKGKAQSKRMAFCNAVLDLLEWMKEEREKAGAAAPPQDARALLTGARASLVEMMRNFPTDSDMAEAGWEGPEIDSACNAHERAGVLVKKLDAALAQPAPATKEQP